MTDSCDVPTVAFFEPSNGIVFGKTPIHVAGYSNQGEFSNAIAGTAGLPPQSLASLSPNFGYYPSPTIGNGKTPQVNNPKHAAGSYKQPYHHIPPVALAALGSVMQLGGNKYGPYNWGEAGIVASIYYDAILRHLFAWYTTGLKDTESKQSHLAHIMACCAILIDCETLGNMQDDRPLNKTTSLSGAPNV